MSNSLLCNLISCYQVMLPKALKASIKTNINKKYETYISLNGEIDIDEYICTHKRRVKEIEIIKILREKGAVKIVKDLYYFLKKYDFLDVSPLETSIENWRAEKIESLKGKFNKK